MEIEVDSKSASRPLRRATVHVASDHDALSLDGARQSGASATSTFSSASSELALHYDPANIYPEPPQLTHGNNSLVTNMDIVILPGLSFIAIYQFFTN
jgi:hypothetical protein